MYNAIDDISQTNEVFSDLNTDLSLDNTFDLVNKLLYGTKNKADALNKSYNAQKNGIENLNTEIDTIFQSIDSENESLPKISEGKNQQTTTKYDEIRAEVVEFVTKLQEDA